MYTLTNLIRVLVLLIAFSSSIGASNWFWVPYDGLINVKRIIQAYQALSPRDIQEAMSSLTATLEANGDHSFKVVPSEENIRIGIRSYNLFYSRLDEKELYLGASRG